MAVLRYQRWCNDGGVTDDPVNMPASKISTII
jgi:hypothetical protein